VATVPHPLVFARRERELGEGEILVRAFGTDARGLNLASRESVPAALESMWPGIRVSAVAGDDWMTDEFARETGPMFRRGQLNQGLHALRAPRAGSRCRLNARQRVDELQ
jgi:hypothetical protein